MVVHNNLIGLIIKIIIHIFLKLCVCRYLKFSFVKVLKPLQRHDLIKALHECLCLFIDATVEEPPSHEANQHHIQSNRLPTTHSSVLSQISWIGILSLLLIMPRTSIGSGHYEMMVGVCLLCASTTERPRKPKIGRMEAHHTGNPWTYLKVKKSKVKVKD